MIRNYKHLSPKIAASSYIFPGATIIGNVTIGENVIVYPGCVIRGECNKVVIGDFTNIQENSTLHVEEGLDVIVGNGVTVGHNSILHGCTIADNVLIGMGAIIQDGAIIGEESFIGAGCLIKRNMDIPPRHTAYGFPVNVIRPIKDSEHQDIKLSTDEYQEYLREMRRQEKE
ncbi:gamma carbonic anhydrase family protein [Anaerotignum sp.]|uniref:gamma carbonic anhydrase family protein n=1 Tax=Anaerotignum sp. TaxID=2039241 RepID=UPI0028AE9171|nr:gamma carbonic anhydrase family protein [Anaerotignum sp.]